MTEPREGGAGFELGAAPLERRVHRFAHEAMATVFEVMVAHENTRYARQAADAAFDLVDSLERELSRFIANSDISRLGALVPGEATRIGEAAMDCLVVAQHLFRLTDGAFDVSLGSGLLSLEVDLEEHAVRSRSEGVRLDLGGIGKGYAVDRMAELLEDWGLHHALIHGGMSSVLALDPAPGEEGWDLTLSVPAGGPVLHRLPARRLALGASGILKKDHIQDPRSGEPVRQRLAAWVSLPAPGRGGAEGLHPATVADALSTAFMILPAQTIAPLCDANPGLSVWLLDAGPERSLTAFEGAAPRSEAPAPAPPPSDEGRANS